VEIFLSPLSCSTRRVSTVNNLNFLYHARLCLCTPRRTDGPLWHQYMLLSLILVLFGRMEPIYILCLHFGQISMDHQHLILVCMSLCYHLYFFVRIWPEKNRLFWWKRPLLKLKFQRLVRTRGVVRNMVHIGVYHVCQEHGSHGVYHIY
jgi:hypothetical protein